MSSNIAIKFNKNSKKIIYPSIIYREAKKDAIIYRLKNKITSSSSILEKQEDIEEEDEEEKNNNRLPTTEKKKKKKKKGKKKKRKCLSVGFKYKIKKKSDSNKKDKKIRYKIKNLSKSFPKLKKVNKEGSSINIPKIDNYVKKNNTSDSTEKTINLKEEFKSNNNQNENIKNIINNNLRSFNFKNKTNDFIKSKKNELKIMKKICMTPKPKIILNPGGNESDSMNGGHSNNYTSKYLLAKSSHYNSTINCSIAEGINSSTKFNIRGEKNAISASINKTSPNEEKNDDDKKEVIKNDDNNKVEIEEKKEVNIEDNSDDNKRKTFTNLLRTKTRHYFYNSYRKKEELEKRFARIRKSYQEKELTQSLQNTKTYIYLILPGNASYLVKNCMCHRINWREPFSTVTSLYNFKWQQLSFGIDYNSLGNIINTKQMVNHFENHYAISNKANMFINMMDYCEKRKISVFKYVPFTIVFQFKDKVNFSQNNEIIKTEAQRLEDLKNFIKNSNKYIVNYNDIGKFYEDENYKKDMIKREDFEKEKIKQMKKKLRTEETISGNNNDDNSTNNVNNIINAKYESNIKVYSDFFPKVKEINKIPTIIKDKDGNILLSEKDDDKENNEIGNNTLVEIPNTHNCGKNIWIIKAINLNRGMCIRVVNSFEEIEKIIQKFKEGVNYGFTEADIDKPPEDKKPKKDEEEENECLNTKEEKEKMYYCSRIIIQKYIERPLLFRGRKCDMRIWVLVTHTMKVYVFKEGHLKTCSVEFNINSKNAFTHITNYSFQKHNDDFQKFEKGNEVPFNEFQKFIDEKYGPKNYKLKIHLMNQIKEIINVSMRSVKDKINKNNRNHQFEIFGYDFMLDEDFNVFLIEINTNPGLEESSPWIKIIVPRMLDDALRLTLDQLFEPKYDFNLNYKKMDDLENLEKVLNNLRNNKDPNSVNNYYNRNKNNSLGDKNDTLNKTITNNKKYISPFPVPEYSDNENLWDFVCDLNAKDPNDEFLDKSKCENTDNNNTINKEQTYTGIKHLLRKKSKTKTN